MIVHLRLHCSKERMNLRGGEGVVVDGGVVSVFPFVVEVSKHAAINN